MLAKNKPAIQHKKSSTTAKTKGGVKTKPRTKTKKLTLRWHRGISNRFISMAVVVLAFAGIGTYLLVDSRAATDPSSLDWAISAGNIYGLRALNGGNDIVNKAFNNNQTYVLSAAEPPDTAKLTAPIVTVKSYTSEGSTVNGNPSLADDACASTNSHSAIAYDDEKWPSTPTTEQLNIYHYMKAAEAVAHSCNKTFIAIPGTDLVSALGGTLDGSLWQTFLDHHYAAISAEFSDVYVIQAEGIELDSNNAFQNYVQGALTQARSVNRNVKVLVEIGTVASNNKVPTVNQLYDLYTTALSATDQYGGSINGFYLSNSSGQTQHLLQFLQQVYQ